MACTLVRRELAYHPSLEDFLGGKSGAVDVMLRSERRMSGSPMKCPGQNQIIVDGELVQALMEIALVDEPPARLMMMSAKTTLLMDFSQIGSRR